VVDVAIFVGQFVFKAKRLVCNCSADCRVESFSTRSFNENLDQVFFCALFWRLAKNNNNRNNNINIIFKKNNNRSKYSRASAYDQHLNSVEAFIIIIMGPQWPSPRKMFCFKEHFRQDWWLCRLVQALPYTYLSKLRHINSYTHNKHKGKFNYF